jgi:hypothetical protein
MRSHTLFTAIQGLGPCEVVVVMLEAATSKVLKLWNKTEGKGLALAHKSRAMISFRLDNFLEFHARGFGGVKTP